MRQLRGFDDEGDAAPEWKRSGFRNAGIELRLAGLDDLDDHFDAQAAIVFGAEHRMERWDADGEVRVETEGVAVFVRPSSKNIAVRVLLDLGEAVRTAEDEAVDGRQVTLAGPAERVFRVEAGAFRIDPAQAEGLHQSIANAAIVGGIKIFGDCDEGTEEVAEGEVDGRTVIDGAGAELEEEDRGFRPVFGEELGHGTGQIGILAAVVREAGSTVDAE